MKYVGVDLHKQSISVCVVVKVHGKKQVVQRQRLACAHEGLIVEWFQRLGTFEMTVEATASYEWFVRLVEPLARRVVLAHPGRLRIIAESQRKSDRLDAQVLAEYLADDGIPQAYRPTPRQREHRTLVRLRHYLQRRITSIKNKLRHVLANYNADRRDVFTVAGSARLREAPLSAADRLAADLLWDELKQQQKRRRQAESRLKQFAAEATGIEHEQRQLLATMPTVGLVTSEVLLSEVADIRRFRSQKRVASYAGLIPGQRESAGKTRQLGITKAGSRLLRWSMIQWAWRIVRCSPLWQTKYERLKARCGSKKAIVAIARQLLCVAAAVLRSGQPYTAGHRPVAPSNAKRSLKRPAVRVRSARGQGPSGPKVPAPEPPSPFPSSLCSRSRN